jgi:hypothetical protein
MSIIIDKIIDKCLKNEEFNTKIESELLDPLMIKIYEKFKHKIFTLLYMYFIIVLLLFIIIIILLLKNNK